ncbi:MAG: 23S rRNA (pseudouridine(1915)-N(3))-methyltransferase RlmH [Bacteroidales bacterium]|jgi:23S rRNA (pseudouridine1915-N3)-methyltransferase|nr:23S rRNA (pseudouridine(1915)-N(3))-methyltransferase RlmH [Bacteroidales bacterium]
MKITLLYVGKEDADSLDTAIRSYNKKINFYNSFESQAIPYLKNGKSLSIDEQKKREGELILKKLTPQDMVVLLDERGKTLDSVQFSQCIQQHLNAGVKNLVFIIAGAYGFSSEVYERAQHKLSLSAMTFPHIMTRLIFTEQLYRGFSILKGEPYHHE